MSRSFAVPLAAALLLLASPCLGASRYEVHLVTMYPGDALFTGFGHLAFRIVDHEAGTDQAFDYGTYDADDPMLAYKFLVGTLSYYCSKSDYEDMVSWYRGDFGGILEQRLDFSDEHAVRLLERLTHDCLPENAAYHYHHFYNNCSTKPRDILDGLLEGALSAATRNQPAGRSLRDLIDSSMSAPQYAFNRWVVFGLLNHTIDAPADRWNQMFLPFYLSREMDAVNLPGLAWPQPVVLSRTIVAGEEKGEPQTPASWPGAVFLALLLLVTLAPLALGRSPRARAYATGLLASLLGLAATFYGVLIVFTWAVSPYPETKWNWTLVAFHPLHVLLVVFGIGVMRGRTSSATRLARYLLVGVAVSAAALLLNAVGVIPQRLWPYALATLATSSGLWLSLRKLP